MNDEQQQIDIEIDVAMIAQFLAANPAFINAVAMAERNAQTKYVRAMGNLYATTAERRKRPRTINPNTVQRTW